MEELGMEDLFFAVTRRIRHILSGWFLLIVANFVFAIPMVGHGVAALIALVALVYALRTFLYGHAIQGLIMLFVIACIWAAPFFLPDIGEAPPQESARKALSDWGLPPVLGESPKPEPPRASPAPKRPTTATRQSRPEVKPWREPSAFQTRMTAAMDSREQVGEQSNRGASVATPEEQIRMVLARSRRAEQARDINATMDTYGARVDYFGQMRSRDEVRADKLAYFRSWPGIAESTTSDPKIEFLGVDHARVRFGSEFTVSNRATGEWRTGNIANTYVFDRGATGWKIVSQKGKVSNTRKGTR